MNRIPMSLPRRILKAVLLLPALAWASADPQIAEFTDLPDPVAGGADYSYVIVVVNSGGAAATNARLTLDVPAGATFVSASATPSGSCSATSATRVVCELGSVASGGGRTVTAVWRAGATASVAEVNATATLTADSDTDTTNNVQTQKTTVNPPSGAVADLQLSTKTIVSGTPIATGSAVTFRLAPRNGGGATATDVAVTDVLPSGWTFVSASGGPNWSCAAAGQTVTCTRATMPAGATDDIDIVATAPASAGPFTNTATIAGSSTDPEAGNNAASVSGQVLADGADLSLTKTKLPLTVTPGASTAMTSTITVANNGPAVAAGRLRVVEVLGNETYTGFSGTGWSCSLLGATVICDHDNAGGLPVFGLLPALTISSTASGAGTATNTACTGGSVPSGSGATPSPPAALDPNATNDCATRSSPLATGTESADLRVVSVVTTTPSGGDKNVSVTENSVTFTSVVSNDGPQGATGVAIGHAGPSFGSATGITISHTVTGTGNATFACTTAPILCQQTGGTLASGDTVTTVVTATRPLPTYGLPAGTVETFTTTTENRNETDPDTSNNSGSDTFTVESVTDLVLVGKTVTPAEVASGQTATYVITVRNAGPDAARDVTLTDSFSFAGPADPGLEVVSVSFSRPETGSCNPTTEFTPAANQLSCSISFLGTGETQAVTLVVRARPDAASPNRTVGNTALLAAGTPADASTADNSATAQLTIRSNAIDLLVNKDDNVSPVRDPVPYVAGATFIDYRVRVTNNGPSDGTNVSVTETTVPPAGKRIRFVCDTTGLGSGVCNPTPLCGAANLLSAPGTGLPAFSCRVPGDDGGTTGPTVGNLANGQTKQLFLRYEVLDQPPVTGDVFSSTSTVSSDQNETFAVNNAITELTTVRSIVDIRVSKAATPSSVSVTQPFEWVVTVVNNGPSQTLQTNLTDTLPAGTTITGPITWSRTAPAGSGSCTSTGLSVSCAMGPLSAAGVATVRIPVRMDSLPPGGTATNSATVDTTPAVIGADDFPGGNNTATAIVTLASSSLSGTVFEDRNRVGAAAGTPQDEATEPRIAGVALRLMGTDSLGNAVDRTTTSDAAGRFTFGNLPPSNGAGYLLTQSQPAGHVNGPASPPSTGAGAPSAGGSYVRGGLSGDSAYTGIVLGSGVDAVGYGFPEVRQPALSGFVYVDVDNNGVRTPGTDLPIAGATVRLRDAATLAELRSTVTDGSGAYAFTGLDPLTAYTLEQPLPDSALTLANGPVNPGRVGGAPCSAGCTAQRDTPTAGVDRIAAIDLSAGLDGTQFDFGETQVTAIAGTVYVDRNLNGTLDSTPTDGRIAGVVMSLHAGTSCTGAPLATSTSAANGSYLFSGLVAGQTYTVCQTQPAGYGDGGVNPGAGGSSAAANTVTVTNLPQGGSTGNHFGERVGAVSGAVYLDANNDGVRQAGEAGIAGVQLTLSGTDATGAPVSRSTTTGADGSFVVGDLLGAGPGGYTLTQQAAQPVVGSVTTLNGRTTAGPSGGTASAPGTAPSAIAGIALAAGATSSGHLFGEILPVGLSGIVFGDANDNGQQDLPGDTGLSGVGLALTGTDDLGAAVSRTLTTAADGRFSVADLRPGTYTLTQPAQPPGTSNGRTVAGSAGGTATTPAVLPSAISAIALTSPGTVSTDNRFAEIPDAGVISGRVWLDADNDGVVDGTESGIAGQTIQLAGTDTLGNAVSRTATTGADGSFAFSTLPPGTYVLTQPGAQPVVGSVTTLNGRTVAGPAGGTASAPGTTPSTIAGISLTAGATSGGHLFGEILPVGLSGIVFGDANDNGQQDLPGDPGLSGVSLVLTGTDDLGASVNRTLTTALDGRFSVADLRPGTYTLTQPAQPPATTNGRTVAGSAGGTATAPAVLPSAISAIALTTPGTVSTDNRFAEIPDAGVISGRVWLDADNDGVVDGTESGIAGQTIQLAGTDTLGNAVSRTAATGADGSFAFTVLPPGTYALTQPAQPAGTYNGTTVAGTAGGAATGVGTLPSAISSIVIGVGQSSLDNNFGELGGASLGGRVWLDADDDGVVGAGESGLAAQTIELVGTELSGTAVSRTTTTGADGSFAFADVAPGTYTLRQPTQPAGTFNGRTVAGTAGGTATASSVTPSAISSIALAAGQTASGYLFGETANGLVSGRVWTDANRNGTVDAGETGLAGVTLVLGGTDALGGTVNVTVTSGADGSFAFTGLRPGTYSVTQPVQPDGTVDGPTVVGTGGGSATAMGTTPSAITGIVLGSSPTATGNLFGELPGARLDGRVWIDTDNDGAVDAGETGIAGAALTLTGTNDLGAAVSATTTTGADGSYAFSRLRPGTYTVTQPTQPAGTFNGQTVAGTAGGTATAPAVTPSAVSGIALAPGQTGSGYLFGETINGLISGRVWTDANRNGSVDAGETGLAGVTLVLGGTDALGGPVSATLTTGADGSFAFTGLRPGTYTVTQPVQPDGTVDGRTVAGTGGGTATAMGTTPSAITGIVLGASSTAADNLFGEFPEARLDGRVWIDTDNDGIVDAGETGIAGVVLVLTGTNDLGTAVSATATTAGDGRYAFGGLRTGTYTVTQPTQPPGTFNGQTVAGTAGGTASAPSVMPSTVAGIALAPGQSATGYDFGEISGVQIAGRVWTDANDDGVIDPRETGLGGVALNLTGTNDLGAGVSLSVTTGADGSYSFPGLRPGTYTITQPVQPAGTLNGRTVAGSAGGTASGPATTPSTIAGIVLPAGQSSTGNHFGEIPGGRLDGRVWLDANHNGVIDAGEGGLSGVAIALSGTDDLGVAVALSATTDADGRYAFSGLRPGTYTLTQPTQPAGTLNGRTVAGTGGGTATGVATTPSAISGIVLAVAQASGDNHFGEIPAAGLSGRVWSDADNDGQIGAGEAGLAAVGIALTGTDDLGAAVTLNATTTADGSFAFSGLRPGTYVLTQPVQPPGTSNGVTVAGSAGGVPTPVATTPSAVSGIVLAAGSSAAGYLFGEVPDSADLRVSKTHTRSAFTVGLTGTYRISVRNVGSLPTTGLYTVQDRLPAGLTLAATPSGPGWTCTGATGATVFSCSASTPIAAGATAAGPITAVVQVGAAAAGASPVSNVVLVEGGGEAPARGPTAAERDAFLQNPTSLPACTAGIAHNACRDSVVVQQAASVSGTLWTDAGSTLGVLDAGDRRLSGWLVEVVELASDAVVGRATTAANGSYRVVGLEPGVELGVRFRDPASGIVYGYPVNGENGPGSSGASCQAGTPPPGTASSCVQAGSTPQLVVVLVPGADLPQQSLPVDAGGVVYDSALRTPVGGAVVTLAPAGSCPGWNPATGVAAATLGGYRIDGTAISMTVGPEGQYQFLLTPSAPAECTFDLRVTPPAGYAFVSTVIPPGPGPFAPGGGAGMAVAVQPQATPPSAEPGPATAYYLSLRLGAAMARVVRNHLPLDPSAIGALSLSKTADRNLAEIGDSVRYTLTVAQAPTGSRPAQTTVVDRLPAGFTYIPGTVSVNGVPVADPAGGVGPVLVFQLGAMPTERQLVLRYRVRVGVGAQQGDGINRAQGHACQLPAGCVDASRNPVPTAVSTNAAQHRVRVLGGVFTTDACVLGKVFVDCNGNHVQDAEELGVPGVRLVLSDGTMLISDSEGKVSLCGLPPRSHVLRVDETTLPRGSRLTTSSSRNLGDAGSLWLDLKNGELHRADFVEGSCSNTVLEQTKARRAQGEVRSVETEKKGGAPLRFDSKAHGLDTLRAPRQGTDGANQQAPRPRPLQPLPPSPAQDETRVPTPDLPMNQPPPQGRAPGDPPDRPKPAGAAADGGPHGQR